VEFVVPLQAHAPASSWLVTPFVLRCLLTIMPSIDKDDGHDLRVLTCIARMQGMLCKRGCVKAAYQHALRRTPALDNGKAIVSIHWTSDVGGVRHACDLGPQSCRASSAASRRRMSQPTARARLTASAAGCARCVRAPVSLLHAPLLPLPCAPSLPCRWRLHPLTKPFQNNAEVGCTT